MEFFALGATGSSGKELELSGRIGQRRSDFGELPSGLSLSSSLGLRAEGRIEDSRAAPRAPGSVLYGTDPGGEIRRGLFPAQATHEPQYFDESSTPSTTCRLHPKRQTPPFIAAQRPCICPFAGKRRHAESAAAVDDPALRSYSLFWRLSARRVARRALLG